MDRDKVVEDLQLATLEQLLIWDEETEEGCGGFSFGAPPWLTGKSVGSFNDRLLFGRLVAQELDRRQEEQEAVCDDGFWYHVSPGGFLKPVELI